jgi:hypothetical protein
MAKSVEIALCCVRRNMQQGQLVAAILFQTLATCKIGKLSFVAGAELPKKYLLRA